MQFRNGGVVEGATELA